MLIKKEREGQEHETLQQAALAEGVNRWI